MLTVLHFLDHNLRHITSSVFLSLHKRHCLFVRLFVIQHTLKLSNGFSTHIVEGALIDYFLRQKRMLKKESDFKEEQKKRMINKNLILRKNKKNVC